MGTVGAREAGREDVFAHHPLLSAVEYAWREARAGARCRYSRSKDEEDRERASFPGATFRAHAYEHRRSLHVPVHRETGRAGWWRRRRRVRVRWGECARIGEGCTYQHLHLQGTVRLLLLVVYLRSIPICISSIEISSTRTPPISRSPSRPC
jgi:hypothetical protein